MPLNVQAFGSGCTPNPPANGELSSCSRTCSSSGEGSEAGGGGLSRQNSGVKKIRGIAAFAIAGSLALLMGGGSPAGDGAGGGRATLHMSRGASRDDISSFGMDEGRKRDRSSLPGVHMSYGATGKGDRDGGAGFKEVRMPGHGSAAPEKESASGSSHKMHRSASVASALDRLHHHRRQQYRFMTDEWHHVSPLGDFYGMGGDALTE